MGGLLVDWVRGPKVDMQYRIFILVLPVIFILSIGNSNAQTTRDAGKAPNVPAPRYQAVKKEKKGFFGRLFSRKKGEQDEIVEFKRRMRKLNRKKRREMRLAEKPQYKDPTYFGHKRPPKKRPLGKRKYCEECGIRH